jgi:hypothetical protein
MIHDVLLVDVNGDHLQPLRPGYNHYTGIPVKPKHNLQQKRVSRIDSIYGSTPIETICGDNHPFTSIYQLRMYPW